MPDEVPAEPRGWRRPTWLLLLIAASVAFSLVVACATPFVAFAAVAACTLPRRDAYALALGVWLANRAVGFGLLHSPWTADCLAWGAALGATMLLSTLAACLAERPLGRARLGVRGVPTFLVAYAAYEAALVGSSLGLGGIEHHTLAIQGLVFAVQSVTLVGLLALDRLGAAIGIAPRPRRLAPLGGQPT